MPQLHNPDIGFAFNANNANVPDDAEPKFGRDWEENFRARRIQQFFDTIDKHSLETSAAMQADHLSLAAKALQPFIAKIAPTDERARQAQALLADWNGVMDKDRPEPLIFTAFLGVAASQSSRGKTGLTLEAMGPFAATTLISLMRDHPVLVRRSRTSPTRIAARAWARARRRARPARQARRRRHEPVALGRRARQRCSRTRSIAMSRCSTGSATSACRRAAVFIRSTAAAASRRPPDKPFARTHGPGFRGLYDLSDPEKSRFMITTGQSGHIFSRHYGDLVPALERRSSRSR